MERKEEERSLLIYVLLSFVTCGIYGIIFYWKMAKDINDVCRMKEEDDSQMSPNYIVVILLSLVTCGIYGMYWYYKQANRLQRVGKSYGIDIQENGTTILLWRLVGIVLCGIGVFVSEYYFIGMVNRLCKCYNEEYAGGGRFDMGDARQDGRALKDSAYEPCPKIDMVPGKAAVQSGLLVCVQGELKGATIQIRDQECIVIGRNGAESSLVIDDMDISRRHCAVQFSASENCYYVTDYSSSGTILNGEWRLEKNVPTICSRGSRIRLGKGSNEFLLQ